jgi:hypothetical protein
MVPEAHCESEAVLATIGAMRASRTLPSLATGLACCLLSINTLAAPPGPGVQPIHVLEFYTDDADDQAKALTLAMRSRVRASKDYSLADGDFALGVFLASLKCGDIPDVNCQTKIGDNLKIDRYVWGTMRKVEGGQVAVDVHLWQRGQQEVRQQVTFSDNLTVAEDQALQKIAEQVFTKLVTFGKIGVAKLSAPRNIEGDLFVNNQPQGKFSGNHQEVSLPVGDHHFEVRSGGKVVAQGNGRVSATIPLDIDLTPTEDASKLAISSDQAKWKKPVSYAAIGVGGAMVLGAAYMSLWTVTGGFGNSSLDNMKGKLREGTDGCKLARSNTRTGPDIRGDIDGQTLSDVRGVCDRSDSFKTMQTVLYPVGGLLIAGGAYLLYSSSKKGDAPAAARKIDVTPLVGQNTGYVDVRVSFLGAPCYVSSPEGWAGVGWWPPATAPRAPPPSGSGRPCSPCSGPPRGPCSISTLAPARWASRPSPGGPGGWSSSRPASPLSRRSARTSRPSGSADSAS